MREQVIAQLDKRLAVTRRKSMNKTKKVAWHKHLIKAKKNKEKQKLQKAVGSSTSSTARR
jgi:hypothetical protein